MPLIPALKKQRELASGPQQPLKFKDAQVSNRALPYIHIMELHYLTLLKTIRMTLLWNNLCTLWMCIALTGSEEADWPITGKEEIGWESQSRRMLGRK